MKALVEPGNGIAQDPLCLCDGFSDMLHFLLDRAAYGWQAFPDIWCRRGVRFWRGWGGRRVDRCQCIEGPRRVVTPDESRACLAPQASQGDTPRQRGEDEKHEGDLGARLGTLRE